MGDWRIFPLFVKTRDEGVIEVSRSFSVPREDLTDERRLEVVGAVHPTPPEYDDPEAIKYLRDLNLYDKVGIGQVRPTNAKQGFEAWYFKYNLRNLDVSEAPSITPPLVGALVKVDLLLANVGMPYEESVDLATVAPLLSE